MTMIFEAQAGLKLLYLSLSPECSYYKYINYHNI